MPLDRELIGDGKIDAFVKFKYRSTKLKTKILTQKKGGEIHWNQEFLIPAQLPIMGGTLRFSVWDDNVTKDEIVGSFNLYSKDIIDIDGRSGMNGKYFWKNIYGAPLLDILNKHGDRMNENPDIASLWKGRILMQVLAEKTDRPVLMVRDIEVPEVNKAAIHMAPKDYQFAI